MPVRWRGVFCPRHRLLCRQFHQEPFLSASYSAYIEPSDDILTGHKLPNLTPGQDGLYKKYIAGASAVIPHDESNLVNRTRTLQALHPRVLSPVSPTGQIAMLVQYIYLLIYSSSEYTLLCSTFTSMVIGNNC